MSSRSHHCQHLELAAGGWWVSAVPAWRHAWLKPTLAAAVCLSLSVWVVGCAGGLCGEGLGDGGRTSQCAVCDWHDVSP